MAMPSRRQLANAVRALSRDAVERAGSGHPGAPPGMADAGEVLCNDSLRHNPVTLVTLATPANLADPGGPPASALCRRPGYQ